MTLEITGFKRTFMIDLCRFHYKGHIEDLLKKFEEQTIITRSERDFALNALYKIEDFVMEYIQRGYNDGKLVDVQFDWAYLPHYTKQVSFVFRNDILEINLAK